MSVSSAFSLCLQEEAAAIAAAADRIDKIQVEKALEFLVLCAKKKGKLVTSGVGKSGIVARKIASTFSSIGLTSLFLNPTDALHGDLGVVDKDDICLLLSNSGETSELVQLIPHLHKRGTSIISIVGCQDSTLGRSSDVVLDASVDKEICPLNLAPTASTSLAMAIGDALAAVWMEILDISPNDFAFNHPAGSLGRKLCMTVGDLMVSKSHLQIIEPRTIFLDIVSQLTMGGMGSICVVDRSQGDLLLGLITDGDLRRALQKNNSVSWAALQAEDIMTKKPITISSDLIATEAISIMETYRNVQISVLPVVNSDQQIQGMLRLQDIIQLGSDKQ